MSPPNQEEAASEDVCAPREPVTRDHHRQAIHRPSRGGEAVQMTFGQDLQLTEHVTLPLARAQSKGVFSFGACLVGPTEAARLTAEHQAAGADHGGLCRTRTRASTSGSAAAGPRVIGAATAPVRARRSAGGREESRASIFTIRSQSVPSTDGATASALGDRASKPVGAQPATDQAGLGPEPAPRWMADGPSGDGPGPRAAPASRRH